MRMFLGFIRAASACASYPFSFEGEVRDLIVLVPDHCLSFFFAGSLRGL